MLISRGNLIRPNVLGFTLFCTILLSEVILGTALEETKKLSTRRNAEKMKTSRQTRDPAEEADPPASGASFAEACYAYIHNFTYSAIVLHNMSPEEAQKWYVGRDKEAFQRLAANLTRTIMKLVEEIDQVGAMFSVHKEVPTDMYRTAAKYSSENCTLVATSEEASSDDTSTVVPFLVFIILALVMYIGFLSYQIKTKYKNSGSGVLIEER